MRLVRHLCTVFLIMASVAGAFAQEGLFDTPRRDAYCQKLTNHNQLKAARRCYDEKLKFTTLLAKPDLSEEDVRRHDASCSKMRSAEEASVCFEESMKLSDRRMDMIQRAYNNAVGRPTIDCTTRGDHTTCY